MPIQITLFIAIFLHQEERRQITTSTRLPAHKQLHHQKSVSPTPYLRPHGKPQWSTHLYQARHLLGLQHCTHQNRR